MIKVIIRYYYLIYVEQLKVLIYLFYYVGSGSGIFRVGCVSLKAEPGVFSKVEIGSR